ncbi:MAG: GNAT family N-acetyltransferase [Actinomycetota bacterium]|nr:GNAT family N-acetyltransferase [Actinomycetota bacterium]
MGWSSHGGEDLVEVSPGFTMSGAKMSVEFRLSEGAEGDYEAIVRIARAVRPDDYVSVADIQDWQENQRRAGRFTARWLAWVSDSIVGSAYVGESPWIESTMMIAHVMVHPENQHQGYGRTLLEKTEATALEFGGESLLGWTQETRPRAMRFLERAGFRENDREWQSTLELGRFDATAWQAALDRVTASGLRIISVGTLATERTDWKRDLHHLYVQLETDVPTMFPILEMPFDDFEALILGRRLVTDGFLVAMDGDQLVGLTEPQLVDDEPTAIAQEMTGVRSDYRGRGVATALKIEAATWAKDSGFTSIRTDNAQSNAPMLAVNTRLGFERDHATVEYLKRL